MNFYIVLIAFLYLVTYYVVFSESTKDTSEIELKAPTRAPSNDYIPTQGSWEMNPGLKSLWIYRPPLIQSHQSDEPPSQRVVLKPPHLVTRLAKPFSFGFDPFFNKGYFEPFETRQKPVTLVTFRKNGIQPRKMADPNSEMSAEVAELQSAFNDISSLWKDQPEVINI